MAKLHRCSSATAPHIRPSQAKFKGEQLLQVYQHARVTIERPSQTQPSQELQTHKLKTTRPISGLLSFSLCTFQSQPPPRYRADVNLERQLHRSILPYLDLLGRFTAHGCTTSYLQNMPPCLSLSSINAEWRTCLWTAGCQKRLTSTACTCKAFLCRSLIRRALEGTATHKLLELSSMFAGLAVASRSSIRPH